MAAQLDENIQYTDESSGELIVNGYIYIGTAGLDAKLNTITIYSDRELTTPLSNPQRTGADGRAVNKIWIPGKYSLKIEDSANVQKLNDLDLGESSTSINPVGLGNVQGTNDITAEGSPTVTALVDKQSYVYISVAGNTGAMTLKIDSTTAYPIKKNHDIALTSADIEADQVVVVKWNDTDSVFELTSHTAPFPYPLTHGGTGATSASGARTNLGLAIGSDVQAHDDLLDAIAALVTANNQMIYSTGSDAVAMTALTAFARTILDDANAGAVRTTLGLGALAVLATVSPSEIDAGAVIQGKLIDVASGNYDMSDGLDPINEIDSTTSTSYVKIKERATGRGGTIRVRFGLFQTGVGTVNGRIYKNGSPVGTERSTASGTAIYYVEDLVFVAGDLIQIYAKGPGALVAANIVDFGLLISSGTKL